VRLGAGTSVSCPYRLSPHAKKKRRGAALLLFEDQGVVDGAGSGGAGLGDGGDFAVLGDYYFCNEDGLAGLLKGGFGGVGTGLLGGYGVSAARGCAGDWVVFAADRHREAVGNGRGDSNDSR
jgi:hypothetical protein